MSMNESESRVMRALCDAAKSPGIVEAPFTYFGYQIPGYSKGSSFEDEWDLMYTMHDLAGGSHLEVVEGKRSAYIYIPRFLLMTSEPNRMKADRLRLMPYPEYLETWEWAQKVKLVRMRDENACTHCGLCVDVAEMNVHHKTYERRGIERLSDLTTVCAHCHYLIHRFDRGVA